MEYKMDLKDKKYYIKEEGNKNYIWIVLIIMAISIFATLDFKDYEDNQINTAKAKKEINQRIEK
tara:strand:+ start:1126 stop:1317 length:192 start_codon:yes stop_codon:yes gene_type:complete